MNLGLARAAATDAGNRSMRAAGRKVWSEADYDAACDELNRITEAYGLNRDPWQGAGFGQTPLLR